MKKAFILFACCLVIQSAFQPVMAAEEEDVRLKLISPITGIHLQIRDVESDRETAIVMNEKTEEFLFPAGHTALIKADQLPPGWAAGTEMKYSVGSQEEQIELPLHPFSAAFQLAGEEQCEGEEFQLELYDEAGHLLEAWRNAVHEKKSFSDLKISCGSRLRLSYTAVPDGFHQPDDQWFTVPEMIAEDEYVITAEAQPCAVRQIRYEPETTGQKITFYRDREDEEAVRDETGRKAVYETAADGTFEANLIHGRYYVSAETTPEGYYPLDHQEFLFDLYAEEELRIIQKPIRINVQIVFEDGNDPGEIPVYLYHEDSLLKEEQIHEEGMICGSELKSGMEITLVPELPFGYECVESIQSITLPETAPEEDLTVCFTCVRKAVPPQPIRPAETSEPAEEEQDAEKDDREEKPVPLSRGYEAAVLNWPQPERPAAEVQPVRSFNVILQDEQGHPLSGAVLRVDNAAGETIAQWISGNDARRISEHVEPGETYLISQQTAVSGYEKMDLRISFTMPKDALSEPTITIKNKAAEKTVPAGRKQEGSLAAAVIPAAAGGLLVGVWLLLRKKRKSMKQVS